MRPLESLPKEVLVQIFHFTTICEFLRCERLSQFFYEFLRVNLKIIQPLKLKSRKISIDFYVGSVTFSTQKEKLHEFRKINFILADEEYASLDSRGRKRPESAMSASKLQLTPGIFLNALRTKNCNKFLEFHQEPSRELLQLLFDKISTLYEVTRIEICPEFLNIGHWLIIPNLKRFQNASQLVVHDNIMERIRTDVGRRAIDPVTGEWTRVTDYNDDYVHSDIELRPFDDEFLATLYHLKYLRLKNGNKITARGIHQLVEAWISGKCLIKDCEIRLLQSERVGDFAAHCVPNGKRPHETSEGTFSWTRHLESKKLRVEFKKDIFIGKVTICDRANVSSSTT